MMMIGIGMPISQARMPFMGKSFPMRVESRNAGAAAGFPGGRRPDQAQLGDRVQASLKQRAAAF